jgi:mannose-6-phosphate isomerase-like protein (cupin superfamily)
MTRFIFITSTLILYSIAYSQKIDLETLKPKSEDFANTHVKKIAEDTFQSSYVIWVKQQVKPHYHANHSEYIHVLNGEAIMRLDSSTFTIRKGDVVFIPQKSIHAVKTVSKEPLKVISIQTPLFDGDRILVEE